MLGEFREKLQKLTYMDFQGHDRHDWLTLDMSDEEILNELGKMPMPDLFLGRYHASEIERRLQKSGILQKLAHAGYPDAKVEISTDRVYNHRLYVYSGARDYDHMLIELRLREGLFEPRQQFIEEITLDAMPMIMVDYLLLQNPRCSFSADRPQLPQQTYPGLGVLKDLIPLVLEVVGESGRAGVLDVPEHYHGAVFYSRWFKFFNPEMAGKFAALRRDLAAESLSTASAAIFNDCLVNTVTGKPEKWAPGEQILPISPALLQYYGHPRYNHIRERAARENRYALDKDLYERKLREGQTQDKLPAQGRS